MIEIVVMNYLGTELNVPTYMEVPEKEPERYVVIEKIGGGRSNYIDSATLAVRSVAESMYEAAALNERVIAAMDTITKLDTVSAVELNSNYNYTNTATKRYRYQAVYDLIY